MYKDFWFDQSEKRNYIGSIRNWLRKEFEPIFESYMGEDNFFPRVSNKDQLVGDVPKLFFQPMEWDDVTTELIDSISADLGKRITCTWILGYCSRLPPDGYFKNLS